MSLNLYCLRRTDHIGWDEYSGHVVAAESEADARERASAKSEICDGSGRWLDPSITVECIGTTTSDHARVILSDFNAG